MNSEKAETTDLITAKEKLTLLAALAEEAAKMGDIKRAGLFANAAIA